MKTRVQGFPRSFIDQSMIHVNPPRAVPAPRVPGGIFSTLLPPPPFSYSVLLPPITLPSTTTTTIYRGTVGQGEINSRFHILGASHFFSVFRDIVTNPIRFNCLALFCPGTFRRSLFYFWTRHYFILVEARSKHYFGSFQLVNRFRIPLSHFLPGM